MKNSDAHISCINMNFLLKMYSLFFNDVWQKELLILLIGVIHIFQLMNIIKYSKIFKISNTLVYYKILVSRNDFLELIKMKCNTI